MDLDLVTELLGDPAYRHVLLNHVPITGLGVAWLVLLAGAIENRWRSIGFGLVLVLVTSGSALAVMDAGSDAYPFVFDQLKGTGQAWLDHHAELADRWGRLLLVNAGLAGAALALGVFRETLRRVAAIGVLVTTLASLLAATAIAESGGKIRHAEFRLTDPPPTEGPGRIR